MEFDSFLRELGTNIRKARWAAGLTQEEVAARGITYRYFQEMERGRRNPTMRTLFTLARILGSTVSLLTQTGEDPEFRRRAQGATAMPPKRGRKPRPAGRQSSRTKAAVR